MSVCQFLREQVCPEDFWYKPVQHPENDAPVPGHSCNMGMSNGPIGEVCDLVYTFQ